jgi:putative thioredoxin
MSSEHIIRVTEADFENKVVSFSRTTPVLVDFWADWSQTSKMLSTTLVKLAETADGAFRLAKVNADENKNLVMQLNVKSLPSVYAFYKGDLAKSFTGLKTETQVKEFLTALITPNNDLSREKALGLLSLRRWEEATPAFRKTLKSDPDNPVALLGLAKSLIASEKASEALVILHAFPSSKEFQVAEKLIPLAKEMADMAINIDENASDLGLMFQQSIRLVGLGNLDAGIDGLMDILRKDRNFKNGDARKALLGVLELMPTDAPETRAYRNELASILF